MSVRQKQWTKEKEVTELRTGIDELKQQVRAVDAAAVTSPNVHSHEFDKLNPTEQSAASLGVSPNNWKPIAFLNNHHYQQLLNANMLDDNLARRIEAYRAVASSTAA